MVQSIIKSCCPYTYQDIIIGHIVKACTAANVGKLSNADTVRRMELFNQEATGGVFDVTELQQARRWEQTLNIVLL